MSDVSESTGMEGDVSAGTSKNGSDKETTGWGSKQEGKQKNSYWSEGAERSMLYVPFATVQRVRLLVGMETMTKVTIRLHDERINYLQCYYRTTKLEEYIYQFRFRDKRKGYLPGTKPLRNV